MDILDVKGNRGLLEFLGAITTLSLRFVNS
jgi:hypothetical protein